MCTINHKLLHVSVLYQFLLGGFYYVEAAVLLEDFHEALPHNDDGYFGHDVHYLASSDVTAAYHNAA